MWGFRSGIVLGGLVTWIISHVYYVISNKEHRQIADKLSSELKELILSDRRAHLSVAELNGILRERTLDPNSRNTLPYKACPKCGSENIFRSKDFIVDTELGDDGMPSHTATPYGTIQCEDCGWRDDEITRDYERMKE